MMKIFGINSLLSSCSLFVGLLFLASCQDDTEELEKEPTDSTATLTITQPAAGGTFSTAPTIQVELTNWELSKAENGMAYALNGGDTVETDRLEFQIFPNQEGLNSLIVFLIDGSMEPVEVADTVTYTLEEDASLHPLQVENGIGSWHYDRGETAWIKSEFDAPFVFSHWEGDNGILADSTVDPTSFTMPPGAVDLRAVGKAEEVSFSQHLFPLMEAKCNLSTCHDEGSAPAYTTYAAIKADGENIVQKTENRQMPPQRHSTLTEEEIEIFRVWVEEGMKEN